MLLGFSILFILAWHFHFATRTEQIMWRVCSIYHAFFSIYGGIYFLVEMIRTKRKLARLQRDAEDGFDEHVMMHDLPDHVDERASLHPTASSSPSSSSSPDTRVTLADRVRNISREQDPEMALPLKVMVPVTFTCALYICCRLFIYVEDFISLRSQPAGVYVSVNQFIPFLGS